jgi:hypothetical protein
LEVKVYCNLRTKTMRKFFWPLFLFFTLAIRALFQGHPDWAEALYSRTFFQGIRCSFDYLLGWMPFPLEYLLFAWLGWRLMCGISWLVRAQTTSIKKRLQQSGFHLLRFLCGIIALFYWLWGFNYNRIPLEQQIGLPVISLTADTLEAMFFRQTQMVLELRAKIQPDSTRIIPEIMVADRLEPEVRRYVEQQIKTLGYPVMGKVRGRQPFWEGFLFRFGASGIYNPFSGESNMERGLYFLSKPYVLAHEFSHGYGFGDEGVCNFLGYLSLSRSDNIFYRYSAELGFWRELAAAYRQVKPGVYQQFRAGLPPGFLADLEQIYQQLDRYPEFFASFRRVAYDKYLKAQGIEEGLQNYDKVIVLVLAWQQKK